MQVAVRIFEIQLKRGDHALLENPRSSEFWKTLEAIKITKMSSVIAVDTDMCQFGLKHAMTKGPVKKETRLLVNHGSFEQHMARKCPNNHVHDHLEGRATTEAAQYTDEFAKKVVDALVEVKGYAVYVGDLLDLSGAASDEKHHFEYEGVF